MNIPAKTLLFSLFLTTPALAAPLATSTCNEAHPAPACHAVRGDRAEGWAAQSRSEVMARNGLVTTSQPLAAQAGSGHSAPWRQCGGCRGRRRRGAQPDRADE